MSRSLRALRSPLLLFALFAPLPCARAQAAEAPDLALSSTEVELGEPFELALRLADPTALEPGAPALDASWAVLGERVEPHAGGGIRYIWRLASLEAGERLLAFTPGPDLPAAPEPMRVSVASVLGPQEDAPRPLRGLPSDFGAQAAPARARSPVFLVAGLGTLLALLAVGLVRFLRRRGKDARPVPAPGARARFEALAEDVLELQRRGDARAVIEAHHTLAGILREELDQRLGRARPAWIEEDWLAALRQEAGLGAEAHAELCAVLADCARVRFGGELPSSFALEALLQRARALLEFLARRPDPGAAHGAEVAA